MMKNWTNFIVLSVFMLVFSFHQIEIQAEPLSEVTDESLNFNAASDEVEMLGRILEALERENEPLEDVENLDAAALEDEEESEDIKSQDELIYDELIQIKELLSVLVATPSEATPSEAEEEDETEIIPFTEDFEMAASVRSLRSVPIGEQFTNMVRYDVSVNNRAYSILFPSNFADYLYVSQNKELFFVGNGTLTGYLMERGHSFNPYVQTGTIVHLPSIIGGNFNSVRHNGAINYFRSFSWHLNNLRTTDTYVKIYVNRVYYPFKVSETLQYITIFMLGGVLILCFMRNYKNY